MTAITQDNRGLIWIGSQGGVVSFDGYNFKVYTHEPGNDSSIVGDYVRSIWSGSDGRTWFGTHSGLSVYDPQIDSFMSFRHQTQDPDGLLSNTVRVVRGDDKGGLWVGTSKGLNYLPPNAKKFISYSKVDSPLHSRYIYSMTIGRDKTVWVGSDAGVFFKTENSEVFIQAFKAARESDLNRQHVVSMLETQDGYIWAGTARAGAHWFSAHDAYRNKSYQSISFSQSAPNKLRSPWVSSLVQPHKNEIWLGTYGGGISVFDPTKNKIIRTIKHNSADPNSLSFDEIGSLFIDKSGLIWIGTWGSGISRTNSKNAAFRTLRQNPDNPFSLSENYVPALLEGASGEIYLGTNSNGVDILDPQRGVVGGIRPSRNGLPEGSITALAQSDPDTLWIGTFSAVYRYDIKSKRITNLNHLTGTRKHNVRTLAADKDYLWIGTDSYLQRVNIKTASAILIKVSNDPNPPKNIVTEKIIIRKDKSVWVISNNGLYVVPAGHSSMLHIKPDLNKKDGLKGMAVDNISVDAQDRIWLKTSVGTERLARWDGKNAVFELVHRDQGKTLIPPTFIADNEGNFWTHEFFYDRSKNVTEPIGEYEGVDIGTVYIIPRARTKDGLLLFGGTRGLLVINPSLYQPWTFQPPLYITKIKINNREISSTYKGIQLNPEDGSFSVEFSALDYSGPKLIRYAYKLEGYDEDWIETASDLRVAKYTNLPPGNYKLLVKGSNRIGDWSPHQVSLAVVQFPAWYQTLWFKIILGLLLAALIYLILEARTRILIKRTHQLKQVVDEKTRDIKSILEAIQQGILTIEDENGNVGLEHSIYLESLAKTSNIAGNNFYDLIFQDAMFNEDEKHQIMSVISSTIGEDELAFDLNSHLLPREATIQIDDKEKIYELDWNPIRIDSIVAKILLVVRDVTELRVLKHESEKHRREIEILQEIINVPAEKFHSLLQSCRRFTLENREIIGKYNEFHLEMVQHLFRNMHTMKGLARSYNLRSLADASHVAEQYYSRSLKDNIWEKEQMLEELDKADSIIDIYHYVNSEKLNRTDQSAGILPVEISTLERNLDFLVGLDLTQFSQDRQSNAANLRKLFTRLVRCPLEQVIEDQINSSASLARQLKKAEPRVCFEDPGFSIHQSAHELLCNVFTHLIRNSIDHGIELPEDRLKKGKSAEGELRFSLVERYSQLQITYSDNGQGLNLPRIHQKALSQGILNPSSPVNPKLIANLIFSSGFSTSDKITEISGRGVGMDAVKKFLEDEHCSIEVKINSNSENISIQPFEFLITIPPKFYRFMPID